MHSQDGTDLANMLSLNVVNAFRKMKQTAATSEICPQSGSQSNGSPYLLEDEI